MPDPSVTSETTLDTSFLGNTIQVCVVTRDHQRTMEAITAPLGARGLRRLNPQRISTPSLVDSIPFKATSPPGRR